MAYKLLDNKYVYGGIMTVKQSGMYKKMAFTLVEVIVAAGIFSVFCVGLFSFYRMGSNMFVKGSWKLRKQKEAERFLAVLKERIEQTSNATVIDPSASNQIMTGKADFVTLNNGTVINAKDVGAPEKARLMMFSVCKPDLSRIDPLKKGLILYNSLMIVKDKAKNLYNLYLASRKFPSKSPIKGIDFFKSGTSYDAYDPATGTGNFTAKPQQYSLGTDPYLLKLSEISSVKIDWGIASGTVTSANTESAKIIGLWVEMQNPKYPSTKVQQRMQAKLDYNVTVSPQAGGI